MSSFWPTPEIFNKLDELQTKADANAVKLDELRNQVTEAVKVGITPAEMIGLENKLDAMDSDLAYQLKVGLYFQKLSQTASFYVNLPKADKAELAAGFTKLVSGLNEQIKALAETQNMYAKAFEPVADPTTTDKDNDLVNDAVDNCPVTKNPDQKDTDKDGYGDACDHDPETPNDGGNGSGEDGTPGDNGNQTPADTDKDGVVDSSDNCPNTANADQKDTDGDKTGDACDTTPVSNDPWVIKYNDLNTKFNDYDNDYDDFKDKYKEAKDDDKEKNIKKYKNKLEDLDDDLNNLEDDVDDLIDDVEDANDNDEYDALLDDLDELKDDVSELRDDIDALLNGKKATLSADSQSSFSLPSAAPAQPNVVIEPLTFTAPAVTGAAAVTAAPTTSWDELRYLLWMTAGIIVLIAVIWFFVALLMRK
ncbi:thrombospondin type 3 repeat-containing protein [Candidatus Woesearchaeota archaeon]|nr:thrombospondin type 3 repeat-containing protein [Candidatus Woesearchaeota archaeon]